MNRQLRLMRLFGIPIELSPSWFVVFALLAWSFAGQVLPAWAPGLSSAGAWMAGIVLSGVFFACLVLHELAHSLVARHFGQEVRRITLFLFGGVSESGEEMPSPAAEFWIAIAGPLTSIALGLAFLAVGAAAGGSNGGVLALALGWLGTINFALALFNLVPGFPLDGGRVLRAGIWAWTGSFERATRWASYAGQTFAGLLIVLGVMRLFAGEWFGGMWIMFLGWLLFGAARSAYEGLVVKGALARLTVGDLMSSDVLSFAPWRTVAEAVEEGFVRHDYHSYPVVEGGRLVGLLERDSVAAVPPERWPVTRVSEIMRPASDFPSLAPELPADEALARLVRDERGHLPVLRDGGVVGVLSTADVARRLTWGRSARSGDRLSR